MGRNEELNKKIRDERREQILDAALKIFARKGLGSAKVSDIASAAGVSHGLVYQYFSSKEEIFETLVERAMDMMGEAAKLTENAPGTPLEKIKFFFKFFIEELDRQRKNMEYPYYFLIMIQAGSFEMVSDKAKAAASREPDPLGSFFYNSVIEGQKTGEIVPGDPMTLTTLLMQLCLGMALGNNPHSKLPMPDADQVIRILKP